MKKKVYLSTAAVILIIFSSAFIFSSSQKTTKYSLAAPYTVSMAEANQDVYMIKGPDLNDSSRVKASYYNIDKLDEFIGHATKGEKCRIRVIKYANGNEDYALKWMYDIEYDNGRYKLSIYVKDSVVDDQYRPIYAKTYEAIEKTGNNSYKLYSGQDQDFEIL